MAGPPLLHGGATDRERMAARIGEVMDGPVTVLGVIFLLVVVADTVGRPTGALAVALDVVGWMLWAVFAAEFVIRAVVAPSAWGFLRRHWWQLIFLVFPFLRFARVLARLRVARLGRVVASAVRSSRSAGATLSSRVAWLAAVTAIVILSGSQALYEFGGVGSYGDALHRTALATITGEPIAAGSGVARVLEVALALYSVVVFAALAGMLGAFFLERRAPSDGGDRPC